MEARTEKGEETESTVITSQLLKAKTGEFAVEAILLLKLRGLGLVELGCLGECSGLEWLDLSGNAITHLGPLSSLKALVVLNLSSNRITSLEPLAGCQSLQSLNAAGNLLNSLQLLRYLTGLQHLESLRFSNPTGRLSNPFCASTGYRTTLAEMFPKVKVIDGERVLGRGSELYLLCRDLDSSLKRFQSSTSAGAGAELSKPWVEGGYWDVRPTRRSSIVEEAYKQFSEALQECWELGKRADETIAQAERVLNIRSDAHSYLF